MPLPKMPTKPASALSVEDYPKADAAQIAQLKKTAQAARAKKSVLPSSSVAAAFPASTDPAVEKTGEHSKQSLAPRKIARDTNTPMITAQTSVQATKATASKKKPNGVSRELTKLFVLDTNVLMHDPTALFRFEEHDVYLPMITLEELDNHKKGMSEVARNARQVSRSLDALISGVDDQGIDQGIVLAKLGHKEAKGRLFFQTRLTNLPSLEGLPSSKADHQILAVVKALKNQQPERTIVLVSKDINMRIKARALGLPAEEYLNDHVLEDTDLLYSGILPLPDDFWAKHAKGVESWQENKNNTSTTFYRLSGSLVPSMLTNQFVFLEPKNGEPKLYGQVTEINGKTVVIRTLQDYRAQKNNVWGITARNREQNFAFNLLMDTDCDFVTLLGQAGTGKTLLALAAGLTQVLETKRYNEIIITRVTVPVGEDIGFLPGSEEEKMSPWMGALDDNLEVLNKSDNDGGDWGKAATNDLIRSRVKIKSLNFMRGRTFVDKFVIIDEAQNLTPKQMKTLITRAGPGTKIICLGNIAQIDTPYLTEGSSGLTYVVDRFKGWEHSGHVTLNRGERSRLADHASEVL